MPAVATRADPTTANASESWTHLCLLQATLLMAICCLLSMVNMSSCLYAVARAAGSVQCLRWPK